MLNKTMNVKSLHKTDFEDYRVKQQEAHGS